MKTKIEYPRNGFSHHALVAKAKVTTEFAKRDADLLADYGIDATFISEFEAKIQKLETVSTFDSDKADKVLSTSLRVNTQNELHLSLKRAKTRFSMVFPIKSDAYKQYMLGRLASTNIDEFIKSAENILAGLKKFSAQLSFLGVNSEFIASLENQIADFNNVRKNDEFIKETTDDKTQERVVAKKAVFSDLSNICRAGKVIWEDDNPARYKDYLIYKRTNSVPEVEPASSPPIEDIYEELEGLS